MSITAPPTIPQITDPATFAPRAQAWVVWQAEELYPFIIDASQTLGLSTNSTSTTSNTIGTGAKTFTVQTGKGYVAGQSLSIARTSAPANRMFAVVTSYNSGTGELVVNVQAFEGSGTFTDWSIALAFNGVVSSSQLAEQVFNDLTTVTLDPATDFFAIADTSDSGNKKKALFPIANAATYNAGTDDASFPTVKTLRENSWVYLPEKASTSGTVIDFTGIPAWATEIEIMGTAVSTNGASDLICLLGDAGGFELTGYTGQCQRMGSGGGVVSANSTSFIIQNSVSSAIGYEFNIKLCWFNSSNTWVMNATCTGSSGVGALGCIDNGTKVLSQTLNSVRITTVTPNTFDAGAIRARYR